MYLNATLPSGHMQLSFSCTLYANVSEHLHLHGKHRITILPVDNIDNMAPDGNRRPFIVHTGQMVTVCSLNTKSYTMPLKNNKITKST